MRRRRWRRFDSETLDHRSKRRKQGKESLREAFAVMRRGHGDFPGWFGEQQAGVEAGERANFVARHLVGTGMSLCLHSGRQLLFHPLGRDADSPVDPGRWRNVVQGQPGGIVRSED